MALPESPPREKERERERERESAKEGERGDWGKKKTNRGKESWWDLRKHQPRAAT
jgi:hypothetical protein